MANQNPNDDPLQMLHALKIGLCIKISQGNIFTGPAINLFNDMIDSLIEKRDDADGQEENEL